MKRIILMIFFASSLLLTSCKGQNGKGINENIEPKAFAEKVAVPGVQLIDVRTPDEYGNQHLDNAKNINVNDSNFEAQAAQLDKNKPVYVYCLSGGRSAKAADKLASMGFKEVYNMAGGITRWNAEGLGKPVNKGGMTLADYQKTIQSDKKVLVDFYAEWCGPCKKMAPYLAKMKEEMKGELVILKVDADQSQELATQLQIEGLPTLILYKDGKEVWKHLGYISEQDLKKKL